MAVRTIFANFCGKYYTLVVVITACLMEFNAGMCLAWPSPVLAKLQEDPDNPLGRQITKQENDFLGAVFSIGGAACPILTIYCLEFLGRKKTISILGAIFLTFYILLIFSSTIYMYYICRTALGLAVGSAFIVVAIYVSEITPPKTRAICLSLGTSFILIGLLFSYSIGPFVSINIFNLILALFSAVFLILFVFLCPESPYYSMKVFGVEKTSKTLKSLRQSDYDYRELEDIQLFVKQDKDQGNLFDLFRTRASRKAFLICTILLILQQMTGINVLITYSETIFKTSGVTIEPKLCSIVVSAFQVATCWITPTASTKIPTKRLMIFSLCGLFLSNLLIGLYFSLEALKEFNLLPIFALISYVIFYNCGEGALPWVILGEIYPSNVKSVGTAMSNTIYWLLQFGLTFAFNKVDEGVFFSIFAVFCLVAIVFVHIFVVETRGKSLQEIQISLQKK